MQLTPYSICKHFMSFRTVCTTNFATVAAMPPPLSQPPQLPIHHRDYHPHIMACLLPLPQKILCRRAEMLSCCRHTATVLPPHCHITTAALSPHCRHVAAALPPHYCRAVVVPPPPCRLVAADTTQLPQSNDEATAARTTLLSSVLMLDRRSGLSYFLQTGR